MWGQTPQEIAACTLALKKALAAAGFERITAGAEVDAPTWQAVAVLTSSDIANRVAGRGTTPAVQLATCKAIQTRLASLAAEQVRTFVFEQRKRLTPVVAPPGLVPRPPAGIIIGLGIGVVAAVTGFILAMRA